MIIEYETLLYRIKDDPLKHLGRCSVSEIVSYFMGYDQARRFWQQPEVPRRLSWERFLEWQQSKVHLCNQNLESFCLLLTDDEREAFDLFFHLYGSALEECKMELVFHSDEQRPIDRNTVEKTGTLVKFICSNAIKERPAMYFGSHCWISSLWAMCNGFIWAEKDMGIENSSDAINLKLFQHWLDERYPIAKGRHWDRLFDFLALQSSKGGLDKFYENFEMFLRGEAFDAPPTWIKESVKSALKALGRENEISDEH